MASKKETLEEVQKVLTAHKASPELTTALVSLLAPKTGGATVDIASVTKSNDKGVITHILCSLSGVFLPATEEFFYCEKDGKGINGLKRISKQGESVKKAFDKVQKTSERAIMQDVLDKKLTPEQGTAKLAELAKAKPDYSKVTDKPVAVADKVTDKPVAVADKAPEAAPAAGVPNFAAK
jgi:hypothetical protein